MRQFLQRHRFVVALAAVTLLGFALRLSCIGSEPYSIDELVSLHASTELPTMAATVDYLGLAELHPPLFYVLQRLWASAFGATEAPMRAMSVLLSCATILAVARFVRRLHSGRAALIAAAAFAVLPLQVEFGQEARPFALVTLLGTLSAWACWEWLAALHAARQDGTREQRRLVWRWVALYVLASVAGLYTHYSFAFIVSATALWSFGDALRGKGLRLHAVTRWLAVHAVIALAFVPWLPALLQRYLLSSMPLTGMASASAAVRSTDVVAEVLDGLLWMTRDRSATVTEHLVKLLAIGLVFAAVVHVARRAQRTAPATAYLLWLVIAGLFAFAASPLSLPYSHNLERHLSFFAVPILALLGMLLSVLPRRAAVATACLVFASWMPFTARVLGNDFDWNPEHRASEAADYINEFYQPGDVVIANYPDERVALAHYLRTDVPLLTLRPLAAGVPDLPSNPRLLGLIEADAQTRSVEHDGTDAKLAALIRRHQPKRVWTYAVQDISQPEKYWLQDHKWRRGVQPLFGLFTVSMFVAPEPEPAAK